MRCFNLLPLAALTTAFVIPSDEVMSQVAIESHRLSTPVVDEHSSKTNTISLLSKSDNVVSKIIGNSKNAFDQAIEHADISTGTAQKSFQQTAFYTKAWLQSKSEDFEQKVNQIKKSGKHGHHCKPNMTVYELIAKSKYTTKLAALINEYDDLVQLLNGTTANFTIFAPIDKAFEKIPEHAPKPSKEQLKKVLLYHTSQEFYPAGKVLVTHTVPTLLVGEDLGGEAQRLSTNIGLKGLTVNFYSRIIAIDIVCSTFDCCFPMEKLTSYSLAPMG